MTDITSNNKKEIDLEEILLILWRNKTFILFITSIFSISAVIYSLSLSNIYSSQALLSPVVHESNSFANINNSSFGSLASLTGVSLPTNADDKTKIAIEVLRSRQFFTLFNSKNNILVDLMATYDWDEGSNTLLIDDEVFDKSKGKWLRKPSPLRDSKPSNQEGHLAFMDIFSVSQNPKSGFISISINHYSPYIAQKWLELVIEEINNILREQQILQAESAIKYLEDEVLKTNVAQLQSGLYKLIESHTQKKAIARATPEYVFQTIDPPLVPEVKIKPRRSVICIMAALIGLIAATLSVLVNHYYFKLFKSY